MTLLLTACAVAHSMQYMPVPEHALLLMAFRIADGNADAHLVISSADAHLVARFLMLPYSITLVDDQNVT